MEGLTEGRIVHYVLRDGEFGYSPLPGLPPTLNHRAAIVVRVFSVPAAYNTDGEANLLVFLDGLNDSADGSPLAWFGSVKYDPNGGAGTWHWPEKAVRSER